MAGMLRKLIASGVAAKVIQEARKPENQAKIKKAIADFQAKRERRHRNASHVLIHRTSSAPARTRGQGPSCVRP